MNVIVYVLGEGGFLASQHRLKTLVVLAGNSQGTDPQGVGLSLGQLLRKPEHLLLFLSKWLWTGQFRMPELLLGSQGDSDLGTDDTCCHISE